MSLFRWSAAVVSASTALLSVSQPALAAPQAAPQGAAIERIGATPSVSPSVDVPLERADAKNRVDGRVEDRYVRYDVRAGDIRGDRRGASRLFSWSGTVDSDVFIVVRGRDVTTQGRDRDLPNRVRVNSSMPRSYGVLVLDVNEGRGNIGVIEQPSPRNGYQAVIRIQDPRGGADRYQLTAYWQDEDRRDDDRRNGDWNRDRDDRNRNDRDRDGRNDRGGNGGYGGGYGNADRGALQWSGRVDAVAEIRIRGSRVDYITRSGARIEDVRSDLRGAALPRRAVDVIIDRREGRGDIDVVQQPNARNDYTAVIRINDTRGGAGFYDFAARW